MVVGHVSRGLSCPIQPLARPRGIPDAHSQGAVAPALGLRAPHPHNCSLLPAWLSARRAHSPETPGQRSGAPPPPQGQADLVMGEGARMCTWKGEASLGRGLRAGGACRVMGSLLGLGSPSSCWGVVVCGWPWLPLALPLTHWVGGSLPSLSSLVWEIGWESGLLGSGIFGGVRQGLWSWAAAVYPGVCELACPGHAGGSLQGLGVVPRGPWGPPPDVEEWGGVPRQGRLAFPRGQQALATKWSH